MPGTEISVDRLQSNHAIACMEVWGGNQATRADVSLQAWRLGSAPSLSNHRRVAMSTTCRTATRVRCHALCLPM